MSSITTPYGEASVEFGEYGNGGLAVSLIAVADGQPIAKLSVNLPEAADQLGEGEFFAKTWSENAPIVGPALASGLFEDTGRRVATGFVEAQVWRLKEVRRDD